MGGGEEPLRKAEFVEQGNAICAQTPAELEAISDDVFAGIPGEPANAEFEEAFVEIVNRGTPLIETQLDELRALAAPDGDEDMLKLLSMI